MSRRVPFLRSTAVFPVVEVTAHLVLEILIAPQARQSLIRIKAHRLAAQLQAFMLQRAPHDGAERARAQRLYAEAAGGGGADRATAEVDAASVAASIWAEGLRQQVYLGDVDFVARVQALAEGQGARFDQAQVPRAQRASPLTLADWLQRCASREEALLRAHRESGLTMTAMAKTLGLSVTRIGRLIAQAEAAQR